MRDGVEVLGYCVRERSTGGGEKSQEGLLECLYLMTWNLNLWSSCFSQVVSQGGCGDCGSGLLTVHGKKTRLWALAFKFIFPLKLSRIFCSKHS